MAGVVEERTKKREIMRKQAGERDFFSLRTLIFAGRSKTAYTYLLS